MEELKEECGIVGIYTDDDSLDISGNLFYALYGLQHRGQESCGMAIYNEGKIKYCKELGLVSETFNDEILSGLQGNIGLGHVRYASSQNNTWVNSQPIVVNCLYGMMAVAYNGSLVNSLELGRELCQEGSIFISTCDAELVLQLVSRNMTQGHVVEDAISLTMDKIKGAYAFAMILQDKLIGFRDPNGIRPLCIGRMANAWLLASESCTFSIIGAEFVRDVEPGEIIVIDKDGLHSYKKGKADKTALCIFEFVYFARPDSYIDGSSVHAARLEGGRLLAREAPVDADLVIGAPDSALSAAMGYSRESGIPYGHGLIRNRYVGRTFIQPTQEMRENAVRIKFSALKNEIDGKKIVMLDDSIVRGTTTRVIVQMLKQAGAKEVHLRISSPPVKYTCHYGIDTATPSQLIATKFSTKEICRMVGADSLAYLSLESLQKTPVGVKCGLCDACFTGNYCVSPCDCCQK